MLGLCDEEGTATKSRQKSRQKGRQKSKRWLYICLCIYDEGHARASESFLLFESRDTLTAAPMHWAMFTCKPYISCALRVLVAHERCPCLLR